MQVTDDQLEFIQEDIVARGITIEPLAENLVDHICCLIESQEDSNFEKAYGQALKSFGAGGLQEVEENTKLLLILKREITMKKLMFNPGLLSHLYHFIRSHIQTNSTCRRGSIDDHWYCHIDCWVFTPLLLPSIPELKKLDVLNRIFRICNYSRWYQFPDTSSSF
ncbi:MAG: hypothetical protein ACFHWX_13620 [Bacteroidota bacterium]